MPTYVKQDGTADSKTINNALILAAADDNIIIIQDSATYGTSSGGESDFSTGIGDAITGTINHNFQLRADVGMRPVFDGTGCHGTLINFSYKDDIIFQGITIKEFSNSGGGMIGAYHSENLLIANCTIFGRSYNTRLLHRANSNNSAKPITVQHCYFFNAATNYYQSLPHNVIVQDCLYVSTGSSYPTPIVRLEGEGCGAINVTCVVDNQSHTIMAVSGAYNCVAVTTREFGSNWGKAFDVDEAYNCVAFHANTEFVVTAGGAKVDCIEAFASGSTWGDMFVDFSGSNLTPADGGYLHETGLTTGSGTDLSGSVRVVPYDIGAYEVDVCAFWTGFTDDTEEKFAENFIINKANNGRQELSRRAGCTNPVINRPPAGATIRGSWSLRNRKKPYLATQGSQTPDDITN